MWSKNREHYDFWYLCTDRKRNTSHDLLLSSNDYNTGYNIYVPPNNIPSKKSDAFSTNLHTPYIQTIIIPWQTNIRLTYGWYSYLIKTYLRLCKTYVRPCFHVKNLIRNIISPFEILYVFKTLSHVTTITTYAVAT